MPRGRTVWYRSFLIDACLSCSSRPSKEEPTPSPGHVFQCLTSIIARKIFFFVATNASLLLFHSFSYSPYHTQVLQEQTIALVRFEKLPRLDSFQRDHGNYFLTAHDPTCSQVSASQPNQNHRCSRASNFIVIPIIRYSELSLQPMHLPLQYHQPLPWPILRKEKPPETFKKEIYVIPKCQQLTYLHHKDTDFKHHTTTAMK